MVPQLSAPSRRRQTGWAMIAATAIAIAYLALTPWTSLWDRDETRFAQAAVEMRASGQSTVPTFNGELRADKPILASWLMAQSLGWMGRRPLAFRLWSPLAIALTAAATYAMGRRLLGHAAAMWSMAVLATSPLCLAEGLAATADALLLAAVTTALAVFSAWIKPERPGDRSFLGQSVALALALCLGLYAKGPVALVIVALPAGGTLWLLSRSIRRERIDPQSEENQAARKGPEAPRYLGIALIAATAAIGGFCLWAIPANQATGGELARVGIGRHLLSRIVEPFGGHGRNPVLAFTYYPLVLWAGFFPWISLLPAAISRLLRPRAVELPVKTLLLSSVIPLFCLLSAVATKLPHYLLPVWPPLALAVGALLAGRSDDKSAVEAAWLRGGVYLALPPLLIVIAALGMGGALPWLHPSSPALIRLQAAPLFAPVCGTLALVVLTTGAAALRAQWLGRVQVAARWHLVGSAIVAAGLACGIAPEVDALKPVPALVRSLRWAGLGTASVAQWGFAEPSLVFELGSGPVEALPGEAREAIRGWLRARGPAVLVTTRSALETAGRGEKLPVREVASARGLDISHGGWVELVAVTRSGVSPVATGDRP
jgi:4-amino-4-deoxy-L-arabinose transferase-like glycosyltransferase